MKNREEQFTNAYLTLSLDNKVTDIQSDAKLSFDRYVNHKVENAEGQLQYGNPVPNALLLHCLLPKDLIPNRDSGTNQLMQLSEIQNMMQKHRISPIHRAHLHHVLYCRERNVDPFSPDASPSRMCKEPGYAVKKYHYSLGKEPNSDQYRLCKGIETDKGIQLFDYSEKGLQGADRCMEREIGQLFDSDYTNAKLQISNIIVTDKELIGKPDQPIFIPSEKIAEMDLLRHSVRLESYHLGSTVNNYVILLQCNVGMNLPDSVPNIVLLSEIFQHGYDPHFISMFPYQFGYADRFQNVDRQLQSAPSVEQFDKVQKQTKMMAGSLLKTDFPHAKLPFPREHLDLIPDLKSVLISQSDSIKRDIQQSIVPENRIRVKEPLSKVMKKSLKH